ncbi:hypothetical protein [Rosenbergiella nectarea]|uniref:hypothetical protein n=1 Tax=Rosenbergiella nectarea TaxID=988801 RepID=UPI001F4DD3F9|nr:hypothetical protein [Rosenbergiella nectarea]
MPELVMKVLGLNRYLTGGKDMADRLRRSGVSDISVSGRGTVTVKGGNAERASQYRAAAKRFVENDVLVTALNTKGETD